MDTKRVLCMISALALPFTIWAQADRVQQQHVLQADSLRQLGEKLQEKGRFKKAQPYYADAVTIYKQLQDTASWLETGLYYSEILAHRSEYEKAGRLLEILQGVDHPARDMGFRSRIQRDLGWIDVRKGLPDSARHHYEKGLRLASEARDSTMIAYLLTGLGQISPGEEALKYYKKAQPYFEATGNQEGLAMVLNDIGYKYHRFFMYDKAMKYYTKSLDMLKKLEKSDQLGTTYKNLGDLQSDQGNYRQALVALQKSLDYRREAGDPNKTGETLNGIGILYSKLGASEKALAYFRESIELPEDVISAGDLAERYQNIADRLRVLDHREEALKYYKLALPISRQGDGWQTRFSIFRDLSHMELKGKNYRKAEQYARNALASIDSVNNYKYKYLKEGNVSLGDVFYTRNQFRQSLSYYQQAYEHSLFLPATERIPSLLSLARAYNQVDSDSTLLYGRKAFDIIEEHRIKAGAISELRSNYFKQYSDFYIDLAAWVYKYNGDEKEAYRLVEAAKARTLADELHQVTSQIDDKLSEDVRIRRNKMLTRIDRLYTALGNTRYNEPADRIKSKIHNEELAFEAFQNELHEQFPEYKSLISPAPVSLEKARSTCENNTAILEFAVSKNYLISFLISREEVDVHLQTLAPASENNQQSPRLTRLVQKYKDTILSHAPLQELDLYSGQLYRLLLDPFEKKLSEFTNLIIVPDGPLAYLPFEALRTMDSYLIEQFDIKYEPSITSYTLLKKPDRDFQQELLAVAGSGSSLGMGNVRPAKDFPILPSTLVEIDSVSSRFSKSTVLKEEVTESKLKSLLNNSYRFIHLATHGTVDEDNPAQNGLVLSSSEEVGAFSKEDGFLKSSEIYRLNLRTNMVVLSACNSGIGKVRKGEGILGLQRAFFSAGTPSVVVSLWGVYDRSTAFLMNEFYKHIGKRVSGGSSWYANFMAWMGWDQPIPFGDKSKAIKEAKLALIDHSLFNHPVYWAPFILVGR